MTSLGKLVFNDTHSRHPMPPSITSLDDPSVSLAFESLFSMPYDIIEHFGATTCTLDISHNKFGRNLHFLAEFENLTSLNLDHNNIDGFTIFPFMPKLQLLWLNSNNIEELFPFLKNLHKSLPNLKYLSLMGNKAAPSYINGGTFYDYLQYRLFVISWFPQLVHLDDRVITDEQRSEAKRLFKRPFFEEFFEKAPIPDCIKFMHEKLAAFISPISLPEKFRSTKSNLIV